MTKFAAEASAVSGESRSATIRDFTIDELPGGGWAGRATLRLLRRRHRRSPWRVWNAVGEHGIAPGRALAVELKIPSSRSEGGEDKLVRSWPSVVTGIQVKEEENDRYICELALSDPVGYFAQRPIWGVFRNASPGEIVGGALTLAAGVGDRPTLAPVLPDFPVIDIKLEARGSVERVPYAIAAGEPLGLWLPRLLGDLGLELELLGVSGGKLRISLRDGRPASDPVGLQLAGGHAATALPVSASHATVISLRLSPNRSPRGTLLDNQTTGDTRRLGAAGPVESVLTAAELGVDEAAIRMSHQGQRSSVNLASLEIVAAQPGLLPGRPVKFINQSVLGADRWQVVKVTHLFTQKRLRNVAVLAKDGFPWRHPRTEADGPITVSGVIDDGESERGETVARDRVGRIPVRFPWGSTVSPDAGGQESSTGRDSPEWSPGIRLPLLEPMAGAQHGFVPSHRQGDLCRVSVHGPTSAEIVGFSYRDDRRLGLEVYEASSGMVVRRRSGDWQGLGFWPDEDLDEVFQEDGNE